ncbi:heme lyase CcmF/NrfE family subunit [Brevundimonas aveniformis]|uniref:heme lyase CcmF/NrfE family subunit n=1 Tax=Brevundimonas aveniformis TaxID=370977 RepID=UPI0024923E37|nr:heme lyase CcmF/NrfE family subunit [Brevundimonas aveniformis]
MIAEIGHLALILAFLLALVQAAMGLSGGARRDGRLMAGARASALFQLLFVAMAFVALAICYLIPDFSVALVQQHSHSTQPWPYRLAATWGSHEGSLLLWVLILAIYGAAAALFGRRLRPTLVSRMLGVQALIAAAFLGFALFTSNPFLRLDPAPLDGAELNPLLQDPGLVLHPPLLYLGYVGFSAAFSLAAAALIEGRADMAFARWLRPWIIAAWSALTLGIALGSWWAYYELGWGGWWFWDPVENASLMPWLAGTALLHSAIVLEKRGALISWTLLLSILTFSLSLLGTFLVRSGVLTSVHAFAVDPARGTAILGFTVLATGAALALYGWRAPSMQTGAVFSPVSREAGLALNNLFLMAATATVFLGTFYPVFVEVLSQGQDRISVGPPYYAITFVPLVLPLLAIVAYGPMLNWKRDSLKAVTGRLKWPLLIAALALVVAIFTLGPSHVLQILGATLGVWLIAGSAWVLVRRWTAAGRDEIGWRIRKTPPAVWALCLAHAGLGMTALGIASVTALETETVATLTPGQSVDFAGRRMTLTGAEIVEGPNYRAERVILHATGPGVNREIISERRFYPVTGTWTTEAGIDLTPLGAYYVSVGERRGDGVVIRAWNHPMVGWIWWGGLVMAFGGALSLADRRLRLAAPAPRAPAKTAEAAP